MGQSSSACKDFIPDTVDAVQFQIKKHSKILSELNDLTYEQFQESLTELNDLWVILICWWALIKNTNVQVTKVHR